MKKAKCCVSMLALMVTVMLACGDEKKKEAADTGFKITAVTVEDASVTASKSADVTDEKGLRKDVTGTPICYPYVSWESWVGVDPKGADDLISGNAKYVSYSWKDPYVSPTAPSRTGDMSEWTFVSGIYRCSDPDFYSRKAAVGCWSNTPPYTNDNPGRISIPGRTSGTFYDVVYDITYPKIDSGDVLLLYRLPALNCNPGINAYIRATLHIDNNPANNIQSVFTRVISTDDIAKFKAAEKGGIPYFSVAFSIDKKYLTSSQVFPSGLSTAVADKNITLKWAMPDLSGVTAYNVYRKTGEAGLYSKIGASTQTVYVDTLSTTGKYFYRVSAVTAQGETPLSDPKMILFYEPIPAPASLTCTVYNFSTKFVSLVWPKLSMSGISYYNVYRSEDSINFTSIRQLYVTDSLPNSSCSDDTVVSGKTYYYKVTAVIESTNTLNIKTIREGYPVVSGSNTIP